MRDHERLDAEIAGHYAEVPERERLARGHWVLERVRTWELLGRHLPPPPGTVLDVGGAAGVYALPLAEQGYEVHWSTRWRATSSRRCRPPPASRPRRWRAPRSARRGDWTAPTPASTPCSCSVPSTT
jgi:hypothetical protein